MKNKELIAKARKENITSLKKEIDTYNKRVLDLIKDTSRGKIKNVRELRLIKKSIARINTIIKEKEYEN